MVSISDVKSKIDLYEPKKSEIIFEMISKNNMMVYFDKVFKWDKKSKNIERINLFILKKKRIYAAMSEKNETGKLICTYVNYFIKNYDFDNELITAYLKIKFFIDRKGQYAESDFIYDLYNILLTETMTNKIKSLVEDCYVTELDEDEGYKSSIQFTNRHAKMLMCISMATKFFAPLINHYAYVRNVKNISDLILQCFDGLFPIFQEDVDLYNKLYETANIRILKTKQSDKGFWNQAIILGHNPDTYVIFLVKKLMMDAIPKYKFSANCISYNHVFLKTTIDNQFKIKYSYDLNPLVYSKVDSEGLSGFDKFEMTMSKKDESLLIIGDVNVKQTMHFLLERFGVQYTEKDINFYKEHLKPTRFQRNLIFQFFAKYFGSCRNLYNIKFPDYYELVMVIKNILDNHDFKYLQYLLTSNVDNDHNSKKMINRKQILKIYNSPRFKELMADKYKAAMSILENGDVVIKDISILLSGEYSLVDHRYPEYLDRKIIINDKDVVCDEYLRFMQMI
jgi:hypothetical protein